MLIFQPCLDATSPSMNELLQVSLRSTSSSASSAPAPCSWLLYTGNIIVSSVPLAPRDFLKFFSCYFIFLFFKSLSTSITLSSTYCTYHIELSGIDSLSLNMNLTDMVLITRSSVKEQTFTQGFWNWVILLFELTHTGDCIHSGKRDSKYSWHEAISLLLKI